MTENQIEMIVERKMDALDAKLLSGLISQSDYDNAVCDLDKWGEIQYKALRDAPFRENFRNYS